MPHLPGSRADFRKISLPKAEILDGVGAGARIGQTGGSAFEIGLPGNVA
jgi:hypothetical protein